MARLLSRRYVTLFARVAVSLRRILNGGQRSSAARPVGLCSPSARRLYLALLRGMSIFCRRSHKALRLMPSRAASSVSVMWV